LAGSMALNLSCPHRLVLGLLGPQAVAALVDYVVAREAAFVPARVHLRGQDSQRVDPARRKALLLADLSEFRPVIENAVRQIVPLAMAELGLIEPAVEPREFEISAHTDGGHFEPHVDTVDRLERVRILSCVYYFATTPRHFDGGELRLYGFPGASKESVAFVDISPETDSLIMFPSWMRHEIRPVRVRSGIWRDARFAINCWVHRTPPNLPAG
jgi:SM-20-related protein